MTFYESIFLRQFSMKLLGLPTAKHFFSFILGCPPDFNFAQPFRPFSPVSTQPYQNGWVKLKVLQAFQSKTKICFVVASFSNSSEKSSSDFSELHFFPDFCSLCTMGLGFLKKKRFISKSTHVYVFFSPFFRVVTYGCSFCLDSVYIGLKKSLKMQN